MHDLEFYVYIITNKRNGTLYIGHTDNLILRMEQHTEGECAGFSKRYNLKHLVWYETHQTREDAFKRERQLKEWRRNWKLELIETQNPHWIDIFQSPQWPLPNRVLFPEVWRRCMDCRIDPSFAIREN